MGEACQIGQVGARFFRRGDWLNAEVWIDDPSLEHEMPVAQTGTMNRVLDVCDMRCAQLEKVRLILA